MGSQPGGTAYRERLIPRDYLTHRQIRHSQAQFCRPSTKTVPFTGTPQQELERSGGGFNRYLSLLSGQRLRGFAANRRNSMLMNRQSGFSLMRVSMPWRGWYPAETVRYLRSALWKD